MERVGVSAAFSDGVQGSVCKGSDCARILYAVRHK